RQLPWWTFPLSFAGLASVIFTSRSQRIGDLVAGTMLINFRGKTSLPDTEFMEIEDDYTPSYPQVMQMTDRDINTLKSLHQTIERTGDTDLTYRIAEKIRSSLKIENDRDNHEFLITLLKDYNYYTQSD